MSWNTDQRFPRFEVDGVKFMLTFQDQEIVGSSVILLTWDGNSWVSWGGTPDVTGYIVEGVTDAIIMAHGSLREFIVWCADEALRRARLKAQIPLPDPDNRIERLKYNLLMSVDWDGVQLVVKPAPLP